MEKEYLLKYTKMKKFIWVPELIFGHLSTSSNYDDSEKKVTGGRNGYGAKLANIFSTKFIVETTDSSAGKKYYQIFENNMSITENPKLTSYSKKEEYAMIRTLENSICLSLMMTLLPS